MNDKCLPLREKRVKKQQQPDWMTYEIIQCMAQRDHFKSIYDILEHVQGMRKTKKTPGPTAWPEMRDSQRNVLRAQNFAKFWSVSIIQPDIKGISSELRS